jgi:hypothetical protein
MPEGSSGIGLAPADPSRRVTGPMALAGLLVAGGVVTRLFGFDHAGVTFCYFKAMTGYACFTCGSTRALGALSRFDVPAALAVQPLVTLAVLAVLAWGCLDLALLGAGKRTEVHLRGAAWRWAMTVFLAAAILNWIYLLRTGV